MTVVGTDDDTRAAIEILREDGVVGGLVHVPEQAHWVALRMRQAKIRRQPIAVCPVSRARLTLCQSGGSAPHHNSRSGSAYDHSRRQLEGFRERRLSHTDSDQFLPSVPHIVVCCFFFFFCGKRRCHHTKRPSTVPAVADHLMHVWDITTPGDTRSSSKKAHTRKPRHN